ncbi:MAG: Hsp70 family protein [Rhodococcus sp. (in: high G+C Gram-positive bacteria)]|jgi:hypothetical protein|uniref:Hsp70 family protein n=1 Tax=Rhodococcus sp. EPR-157 TaxID=1813677 RepID=UPI0007BC7754|nr:Hsp70 family protein [Rhodococcus sp. EPR-157]KZF04349.1 hypothetical protein A2J03_26475 [Rhodococcus sp. EPR-157]
MVSSVGMSMGTSGIRAVRTTDGRSFAAEWFPSAGPVPDAEDVAHAIRAIVDRPDAPHSLGVAFPDPDYSAALKTALVEEYVSEVHIISEIAGTIEKLRSDPGFKYRTVALYDLGATGLEMTVADIDSGTVYATTRSSELSGSSIDWAVREHLLTLDILAVPRNQEEEASLLEFSKEIKEALSTHEATQTSDGQFRLMDRRMFDLQIIRPAERSAIALRDLAEMSEIPPEVVVAIGGGSRIPLVQDVLRRYLHIPVIVPENPELLSAEGAALYATRVDEARPPTPTAARRNARTLLTPLLRFGLPSIVAIGLLSWMLWPDASADRSVAGTPVTTIAETASTTRVTASDRPAATSTAPTSAPVVATTTVPPSPDPHAPTPYVARYDTDAYVAPYAPPPPAPAPAPAPFQLPQIQLPQIQLPALPRLPLP